LFFVVFLFFNNAIFARFNIGTMGA
jgi:hypothetical protein